MSVEIYRLEAWRERVLCGSFELGLKDRHARAGVPSAARLLQFGTSLGPYQIQSDPSAPSGHRALELHAPFADAEVAAMSETTSAATWRCNGTASEACHV